MHRFLKGRSNGWSREIQSGLGFVGLASIRYALVRSVLITVSRHDQTKRRSCEKKNGLAEEA
jgi:hypothetical protein